MRYFDEESSKILGKCHPLLRIIAEDSIKITKFTVIEGLRTLKDQKQLLEKGKVRSLKSKHLPTQTCQASRAFHLLPYPFKYPEDFKNKERFSILAGVIIATGKKYNTDIIWGGDWNQTFDPKKTKKYNGVHFELACDYYEDDISLRRHLNG